MAAPKENEFWKLRQTHGRELEYKTPKELAEKIYAYFQWCDDNPWYKNEAIKGGDLAGTLVKIPTARPYTISGLCIFLGISTNTWRSYCGKEDFLSITTHANEVIYTQKFEGAAVGAFNANIIARDLGLQDKQVQEHSGINGKPIQTESKHIVEFKNYGEGDTPAV